MYDKNITEQAEVNAMAKAIEDAVAARICLPITAEDVAIGRRKPGTVEEI